MGVVDGIVLVLIFGMMFAFAAFFFYIGIFQGELARGTTGKRKRFAKAVSQGFRIGAVATLDDVSNIYKGVTGLDEEDVRFRSGLAAFLCQYMVDLISKEEGVVDKEIEDTMLRQWKEKVSGLISANSEISPYSGLPPLEHSILVDMAKFIATGDRESVKRKADELATAVIARDDALEKVRRVNRWAVPLAVAGLVLTIAFGVLSVVG